MKHNDEKIILFIGRLVENKGVHILLHAFSLVLKMCENAKLVIVGKGEMEYYLKSLANNLGIDKKVSFIGKINQSHIPEIFRCAIFLYYLLYIQSLLELWRLRLFQVESP